jgi:hypothetical protein
MTLCIIMDGYCSCDPFQFNETVVDYSCRSLAMRRRCSLEEGNRHDFYLFSYERFGFGRRRDVAVAKLS